MGLLKHLGPCHWLRNAAGEPGFGGQLLILSRPRVLYNLPLPCTRFFVIPFSGEIVLLQNSTACLFLSGLLSLRCRSLEFRATSAAGATCFDLALFDAFGRHLQARRISLRAAPCFSSFFLDGTQATGC